MYSLVQRPKIVKNENTINHQSVPNNFEINYPFIFARYQIFYISRFPIVTPPPLPPTFIIQHVLYDEYDPTMKLSNSTAASVRPSVRRYVGRYIQLYMLK